MFSGSSLLTAVVLALAVSASPTFDPLFERGTDARDTVVRRASPITLATARRLNFNGLKLLPNDQARAQQLAAIAAGPGGAPKPKLDGTPAAGGPSSIPATNGAVDYTVSIGVGTPPTQYTLLVDTASANTWVGAGQAYVQTGSSVQTADKVTVQYSSGAFVTGTEFNDHLTIGSNLVIVGQSIGVAVNSSGFDGVDGVLGLGPQGLTVGTLNPHTTLAIPTVTDNLFNQAAISQNLVSVSFEPTNSIGVVNGELTFGGTDSTQFVGSINFAPITGTSPSSRFFGINQAIRYGASTNILSNTAGIFDTFTTLTLIQTAAFQRYQAATGGVIDSATTLLKITPQQFQNLQSLFFTINNVLFEFTANAQLWPRALNSAIGGDPNGIFLIVADIGAGSSFGFINGFTFLERFYTVYDTGNKRVGIANTPNTRSTIN